MDINTLHDWFLKFGIKSRLYRRCLYRIHKQPLPGTEDQICLSGFQNNCKTSKYRMVKTIRLRMKILGELLQEYPSLKVIHLVRDPRATIVSQSKVGMFRMKTRRGAATFCARVLTDIKDAEEISARVANSVILLRYEDLVMDPIKMAQTLYDFIGAELSSSIKDYIWNITQAGQESDGVVGSVRRNSAEHIFAWRNLISYSTVKIIDQECQSLYEKIGMIAVTSESMLRNLSVPLWKDINIKEDIN